MADHSVPMILHLSDIEDETGFGHEIAALHLNSEQYAADMHARVAQKARQNLSNHWRYHGHASCVTPV